MDPLRVALTAVEQELASSEPQLAALQKRVAALRQTQAGLRSVLEMEPGTKPPTQTVEPNGIASSEEVGSPTVTHRPSTTEGVRAILAERPDEPVKLDDVRSEFRKRGWVDPEWAHPDAAIYAAIVRLGDNDPHVVREGKRFWKYTSTADNANIVTVRDTVLSTKDAAAVDAVDHGPGDVLSEVYSS